MSLDDDEDGSRFMDRMKTKSGAGIGICLILLGLTTVSLVFGGPCATAADDPAHAECVPDTVVDGQKIDGPDGALDWTQPLQSPVTMKAGYFYGVAALALIFASIWYVGYQKYTSPQLVLADAHFAYDPTRDVYELPGGAAAFVRLGRPAGSLGYEPDEGCILIPTNALRRTAKDAIAPVSHIRVEFDELPPLARTFAARYKLMGPYRVAVAVHDIQEVDPAAPRDVLNKLMEARTYNDLYDHTMKLIRHGDETWESVSRNKKRGLWGDKKAAKVEVEYVAPRDERR